MRYLLAALLALFVSTSANASVYFASLGPGGPGAGYFLRTNGSGDVDFRLIALQQFVEAFEIENGATLVGGDIIFNIFVEDQFANQLGFSSLTYSHVQSITDPVPPDNQIIGQTTIHIPGNAAYLDLVIFDEQNSIGFDALYGLSLGFNDDLLTLPSNFSVPEPSTWIMMILGFATIGFAGYRKRRRQKLYPSVPC